jgi:hypothetical protein
MTACEYVINDINKNIEHNIYSNNIEKATGLMQTHTSARPTTPAHIDVNTNTHPPPHKYSYQIQLQCELDALRRSMQQQLQFANQS